MNLNSKLVNGLSALARLQIGSKRARSRTVNPLLLLREFSVTCSNPRVCIQSKRSSWRSDASGRFGFRALADLLGRSCYRRIASIQIISLHELVGRTDRRRRYLHGLAKEQSLGCKEFLQGVAITALVRPEATNFDMSCANVTTGSR